MRELLGELLSLSPANRTEVEANHCQAARLRFKPNMERQVWEANFSFEDEPMSQRTTVKNQQVERIPG